MQNTFEKHKPVKSNLTTHNGEQYLFHGNDSFKEI